MKLEDLKRVNSLAHGLVCAQESLAMARQLPPGMVDAYVSGDYGRFTVKVPAIDRSVVIDSARRLRGRDRRRTGQSRSDG